MRCPICSSSSIHDLYDICSNCAWEYDGTEKWYKKSTANYRFIWIARLQWKLKKMFKH